MIRKIINKRKLARWTEINILELTNRRKQARNKKEVLVKARIERSNKKNKLKL